MVDDHRRVNHAVILAGGSGTRLWPASRRARPKQFLPLGKDGESLIASSARRAAAIVGDRVMVVTSASQAALVAPALAVVGVTATVLAEPVARNTAVALGLAAVHLLHRDPDAVLGVLPADQYISREPELDAIMRRAFAIAAARDVICTIGIVPTRAETGFGYLELGEVLGADLPGANDELAPEVVDAPLRRVSRFVEKPDAATAQRYLDDGHHAWNAGMFFVRAQRILDDIRKLMPETSRALDLIAQAMHEHPDHLEAVTARAYADAPSISIDHGVMEKTHDVVTITGDVGWSDVGSWAALHELLAHDGAGNATIVPTTTTAAKATVIVDGAGNLILDEGSPGGDGDGPRVIALCGVSDLVVVRSGGSVLVMSRERAQDLRAVVAELERRGLHDVL